MKKEQYIKIRNIVIGLLLVLFITDKLVLYFQTEDLEDDIKFYDNTLINEESQENENNEDTENIEVQSKININNASIDELQTINGIGPTLAQRIIDYRENYGNFVSIEEIKMVKGIGDATYEKIKEYICINE